MEKKGWKILALIFIMLFIIETVLVVWVFSIGIKVIENENKCAAECYIETGFYSYDSTDNSCFCINKQGQPVKNIIMS